MDNVRTARAYCTHNNMSDTLNNKPYLHLIINTDISKKRKR